MHIHSDQRNTGGVLKWSFFATTLFVVFEGAAGIQANSLALVSDSLKAGSGSLQMDGRVITWTVPVAVGEVATLSYTAVISQVPPGFALRNRAVLDDGLGHKLPLDAWARVEGGGVFLPMIFK